MAKMGRRTKLTPELQAEIMELIKQGVPYKAAALKVGIGEKTFYTWRERGRAAKGGKFYDFVDALGQANAVAHVTLTLQVRAHGKKDWRAAAFILERRWPDDWKERKEVETKVSGTGDGAPAPILLQMVGMDRDQLAGLSGCDLDDQSGLLALPGDKAKPTSVKDTDVDKTD